MALSATWTDVAPPNPSVLLAKGRSPICAEDDVESLLQPLSRGSLDGLVSDRLRGLGVSLEHDGPDCLRHVLPIRPLAEGIGDHLGTPQETNTTRVYAKVDLAGLHQVADFELGALSRI